MVLQLAAGGVLGALVACWLVPLLPDADTSSPLAFVPVVVALVTVVGLLAALGPARRGLRISPSEALWGTERAPGPFLPVGGCMRMSKPGR